MNLTSKNVSFHIIFNQIILIITMIHYIMYCKSNLTVQYNCNTDSKKGTEGSSGIVA
jgi:hypothetical protein